MTLQSSGIISLSNIQTEFTGSNPINLSEYHSGRTYVLAGTVGYPGGTPTTIPASPNRINLSNFYGANGRRAVTITLSGTGNYNYVLDTNKPGLAGVPYLTGKMDVTLVIASGARLGSTSAGSYALTVPSSWAAGDTITIINSGTIAGAGGAGGAGASGTGGTGNSPAEAGGVGGPAMLIQRAVTINNGFGTIAGGGGGGGGGGYRSQLVNKVNETYGGSGGGGGRGWDGGAGGAAGTGYVNGAPGGAGSFTAAGNGAVDNANGGNGGSFGTSGSAGENSTGLGGSAGAGGNYVNGTSFVTWTAVGTRLGGAV